jgi:hypothetical protein
VNHDLLTHDEAFEVLDPHLPAIARCPEHAWMQWEILRSTSPALFAPLSKRTRATFVYDHTIAQARREFPGTGGGPRLIEGRGGLTMLEIDGRLRLRFKRMRPNLTTSSIMTAQQTQLHLQLPLPGLGGATNATVGYMTDITETGIERKAIVCRRDAAVLWVIEIAPEADASARPIRTPDTPREPRIGPATGTIEIATDDATPATS